MRSRAEPVLLEQGGARERVDGAFDRRARIVFAIHRSRERDEARPEVSSALAGAKRVFDRPQALVHSSELIDHEIDWRFTRAVLAGEPLEQVQFATHIGELVRFADSLGLDPQDRDLVDQFAERAWRRHYGLRRAPLSKPGELARHGFEHVAPDPATRLTK